MKELHEIPEVHMLNTVSKFGVSFFGSSDKIHDPKTKIEIRVTLFMTRGLGRKLADEEFNHVQWEEMEEDWVDFIFDHETKTLRQRKGKPVTIANEAQVISAVNKVVKDALVNQKFGNLLPSYED